MESIVSCIVESLRYQRGRLARAVRRTIRSPGVREVHRLRVVTRRLRAIVRLARELPCPVPAARVGKRLRRLGRTLGEQRMWDVAMDGMVGIHARDERFAPRRAAATRAVKRELQRLDLKGLEQDLRAIGRRLRAMPPILVAARARRIRKALGRSLERRPKRAAARHEVRIRLKKARYLLEACGFAAPGARRLQTLLGDEHDLSVLCSLAGANAQLRRREREARGRSDRAFASALRSTVRRLAALEHTLTGRHG